MEMFPSLPRKLLEKEVARSKSSGESQEALIGRLLDAGSSLIDLTEEVIDLTEEDADGPGTVIFLRYKPNILI